MVSHFHSDCGNLRNYGETSITGVVHWSEFYINLQPTMAMQHKLKMKIPLCLQRALRAVCFYNVSLLTPPDQELLQKQGKNGGSIFGGEKLKATLKRERDIDEQFVVGWPDVSVGKPYDLILIPAPTQQKYRADSLKLSSSNHTCTVALGHLATHMHIFPQYSTDV